jgi:hypothetical protein
LLQPDLFERLPVMRSKSLMVERPLQNQGEG